MGASGEKGEEHLFLPAASDVDGLQICQRFHGS